MRASEALCLAIVTLTGCAEADPRTVRPPPLVVDRIERLLTDHSCIAPLGQWERHYLYGAPSGTYEPPDWGIDRSVVHFEFKQAGVHGLRSRRVLDTYLDQSLDHRPMRWAMGEYQIGTGRLTVHYCGSHEPQTPQEVEQWERMLRNFAAD